MDGSRFTARRVVGADNSPSKQQIACLFLSNLTQQEGGNNSGHKTDANLGVAELGFWHSQREVAQQS